MSPRDIPGELFSGITIKVYREIESLVRLLLGIGNPLQGDDGAGNYVASLMQDPGWIAYDCGTVPENFTGVIRRLHPDILVIVDAADMGIPPGDFRLVPPEKISGVVAGTHSLPLSTLIQFIEPLAGQVLFIGIQPERLDYGCPLSVAVRQGAHRLVRIIEQGAFEQVPSVG